MIEINTNIKQDVTIDQQTKLLGMITGNVVIDNSSNFIVHGTINGSIMINEGSSLFTYGTINGDIINHGECKIYGIVNGKLIQSGGQFDIDNKAIINDN